MTVLPRPTVAQPVDWNPTNWTGPSRRRRSGAQFVEKVGFAAEDWNFAWDQAVEEEGVRYLYGYGQGRVARERVTAAPNGFDVLFYHRLPDRTFRAAGLYIGAAYLDEDAAMQAWERLDRGGHVAGRRKQLAKVFGSAQKKQAKAALRVFDEGGHVRWRVPTAGVIVFDPQPRIVPKRITDHKHGTAYDWTGHAWTDVAVAEPGSDPEVVEGRLITVVHRVRERSQAFRDAVVALRNARLGAGARLCCEACDIDLAERYGPAMADFVEAHHGVPLHTFASEGGVVHVDDIALLCPNCHRAAHRTGAWTLPELKALAAAHGGPAC